MARQALNFGTSAPNDGGNLLTEMAKVEANFVELYNLVASPDPELAALSGLTSAADALPYFTGSGTAATTTLTAFGRSLIDDADAAAAQVTLALVPGTNVQAYSARLADVAGLSPADGNIIVGDGSTWVAENGATARASLGLGSAATSATGDFLSSADNTVTYAKLQDVSATQRVLGRNTAGSGDPEEVTATQVLDWLGTTRGSILFRGASGWSILSPGTVGQVVQSNGAGADPSYASLAGTGDVTAASAFGTDNRLIRSDGAGKGVQSTGIAADDSNNITGVASINSGALAGFRNVLINGGMAINQRQASSNADDTFAHDRWNILTQTGTVAASTQTLIESGWTHAMRITQSQASAQRFGVEQMVEALASQPMRGSAVTLSARVRMSASTTLRYAVLEWTGTADTITSDVVLDWTTATLTAGNFFLASNLTVTATGSTALTANTAATVSLSTTLGTSVNNVIVLFWTDSTQAQNVTLDIGNVQLEVGATATPFERRPFATEFALCQRYFFKSYEPGTAPGTATTTTGQFSHRDVGTTTVEKGFLALRTPTPMRATPTVTWYSPETGTAARIRHNSGSADATVNSTSGPSTMSTGHPVLAVGTGAVNDLWTAHVTLAVEL